jgi:hypothetical protein
MYICMCMHMYMYIYVCMVYASYLGKEFFIFQTELSSSALTCAHVYTHMCINTSIYKFLLPDSNLQVDAHIRTTSNHARTFPRAGIRNHTTNTNYARNTRHSTSEHASTYTHAAPAHTRSREASRCGPPCSTRYLTTSVFRF